MNFEYENVDVFSGGPAAPRALPVWQHAATNLAAGIPVALLCVVQSAGSSPGRQGFKMSVTATSVAGSVGGGIMEHKFVELARARLQAHDFAPELRRQIHRAQAPTDRSGMICSGEQEILLLPLAPSDLAAVQACVEALSVAGHKSVVELSAAERLRVLPATQPQQGPPNVYQPGPHWLYQERLGFPDALTIVGGGHVALALSRVLGMLDFELTVLDDRPELHTYQANSYAHHKRTIRYEAVGQEIPQGPNQYVVIMTVGYRTDAVVLRQLLHHRVRYLGLMGSSAKVEVLRQELLAEGVAEETLQRVQAPIGLPIHSCTPEEIAISIAAEIIRVRNADG